VIDDWLTHYNRELGALRRLTGEFARNHPKVAGRLRISADAVEDPHVSRLIEGVALLNARIRQKIDDEFPELTDALLDQLYPHYLAPIPAMGIVQLGCQKDLPGSFTLPAGTEIDSEPVNGESCRFTTAQPCEIWPVALEQASLTGRPLVAPANPRAAGAVAVLRLGAACLAPDQTFTKLGIDRLRVFLRGPAEETYPLYELIHNHTVGVALADSAADPAPVLLGPEAVTPMGLERDQGMLPYSARSGPGYRLLTEFFAFPEKLLFFEIAGLTAKTLLAAGPRLDVFLYLNRSSVELERAIDAQSFGLNCVPVVNLFRQRAEPFRLLHTQAEYRVVPDVRRPNALEVFAIQEVRATSPDGESATYLPYYSVRHAGVLRGELRFWQAVRRPAEEGDGALESFLSLADLDLDPELPANWVVSVETLCTNRNLTARLPYGGGHPYLSLVKPQAQVTGVTAVSPLSAPLRLPNRRQGRWRLISHLLLNHLSLIDGTEGAEALKEMLRLYDYRDSPETRAVIDSIVAIKSAQRTARAPGGAGMGALCRGIEIELTLDERTAPTSGAYLLACVLERVFALQATINSFTRLSVAVRGRPGYLHRWPPRAGDKILL
jgi:type VI secretion system protein ImpG